MRKTKSLSASTYRENTIEIPYSRLRNMIQIGDAINGHCTAIGLSASYVEYRVTFIDHWGVMAVPTDSMLEGLKGHWSEDYIKKCKKAHKFKWCNITGVRFIEDI